MADDLVIRVEGLGKRFRLGRPGGPGESYTALRDVIARAPRKTVEGALALLSGRRRQEDAAVDFWALRDVSFDVRRGEVVGVIGRNGAGKSTLLKVLSRITEPTEGRVTIAGRVASLLEVGTGFHPELTGRENIQLNGAILGMSRAEIRRKFDEMVAFAEVEQFLDTPVKRYSSGMYVRLAFAVAAHLEPEILVVDEVLAVGDAAFQKKCLGKISEVAGSGRTVLFVSHNMAAVAGLCSRGILLSHGRIEVDGSVQDAIRSYTASVDVARRVDFAVAGSRPQISGVSVDEAALARGDLDVSIEFTSPFPLSPAIGGVSLRSDNGQAVWGSNSRMHPEATPSLGISEGVLDCRARRLPLAPGQYSLSVWLESWHEIYDHKPDVLKFLFRPNAEDASRPGSDFIGSLDWRADWSSHERSGDELLRPALSE